MFEVFQALATRAVVALERQADAVEALSRDLIEEPVPEPDPEPVPEPEPTPDPEPEPEPDDTLAAPTFDDVSSANGNIFVNFIAEADTPDVSYNLRLRGLGGAQNETVPEPGRKVFRNVPRGPQVVELKAVRLDTGETSKIVTYDIVAK